ncbi:MAG TPA: hypothetical protein VJ438_04680 [Candidatus Nanoarchaeia archaeon]|nr:hypothetical protein [Candidatus Nanoarchaeia archaeon]
MNIKLLLPVLLVFVLGLTICVSALPYSPVIPDTGKFSSIKQVWGATLVTKEGEIRLGLNKYDFVLNNKSKSIILGKVSDKDETYLFDSLIWKPYEDSEGENYLMGCLSGTSFTQKFSSLLQMLMGRKPFSITRAEEEEFEKEGRVIENTPGTGAYNLRRCQEDCHTQYNLGIDVENCDIVATCLRTRSDITNFWECQDKCVLQFNCGSITTCNNLAEDGSCAIKQVDLWASSKENKFQYQISLYFDVKSGLAIKAVINGEKVNKNNIIEQDATSYYFREARGANELLPSYYFNSSVY